jgi:hypothetical protein
MEQDEDGKMPPEGSSPVSFPTAGRNQNRRAGPDIEAGGSLPGRPGKTTFTSFGGARGVPGRSAASPVVSRLF